MRHMVARAKAWRKRIERVRRAHVELLGRPANVLRPRTLGDKLEWRKLFDFAPDLTVFSDKLATRDYIAERLGADVLVPLLWAGADVAALPLERLPRPFMVKCTHGSRFNIPVVSGTEDFGAIRARLARWLSEDYGADNDEPAYSPVPPRLIVEPFLTYKGGYLPEYKFFVFHGTARFIMVRRKNGPGDFDRAIDYYDLAWTRIPVSSPPRPTSGSILPCPPHLDRMRQMAETLAGARDHLRVDFLFDDDRFYVGELTCYHRSGRCSFDPPEYDLEFGTYWRLRWPLARALWTIATRDWPIVRPDRAPRPSSGPEPQPLIDEAAVVAGRGGPVL